MGIIKEFEEGWDAFYAGKPGSENPYPEGSEQYMDWLDGFLSAADVEKDKTV